MSFEPVHEYFALSYSNYLVVPRTALQSAPVELQQRIVDCMNELFAMFPEADGEYWVRKQKDGRFIADPLSNYERGRRRIAPIHQGEPCDPF